MKHELKLQTLRLKQQRLSAQLTHEEVDVDTVAGDSKRCKLLSDAGLDLSIGFHGNRSNGIHAAQGKRGIRTAEDH